jgi:hypothetical protein
MAAKKTRSGKAAAKRPMAGRKPETGADLLAALDEIGPAPTWSGVEDSAARARELRRQAALGRDAGSRRRFPSTTLGTMKNWPELREQVRRIRYGVPDEIFERLSEMALPFSAEQIDAMLVADLAMAIRYHFLTSEEARLGPTLGALPEQVLQPAVRPPRKKAAG